MKKVIRIKESEWPTFKADLKEDIFLKKDEKTKKLIVFSDKEDKRDRTKETTGLVTTLSFKMLII